MIRASIILSIVASFFLPIKYAFAEDYIVMTPDRMIGWEAVGRITFARTGAPQTCTGTLVTPNKVLTAAHCLSLQFSRGDDAAKNLIFQAGKSGTSAVEVIAVDRISYHPNYTPGAGLENVIPNDMAVLHLQNTVERIVPMQISAPPVAGETVSYLGHRANGRNPPRLTSGCRQERLTHRILGIGCQAISGNSGAGIIWVDAGVKYLVAVISAAGNGQSYAAIPDDWLFSLLEED